MMCQRKQIGRSGFSLVEVLVAMSVFSIGALGLAALHQVSVTAVETGQERTNGASLAQYGMTMLQNEVAGYANDEVLTSFPLLSAGLANLNGWQVFDAAMNTYRIDDEFGTSAEAHYAGGDSARYCAYYSVSQFDAGNAGGTGTPKIENLFLVSVRVNWPKRGQYSSDWTDCTLRLNTPDSYHDYVLTKVLTRDFADKL